MKSKLFFLIVFVFWVTSMYAVSQKSPHGIGLKVNCAVCHNTDNWNKIKPDGFNHKNTRFPLIGQHKTISCQKCHTSLVFSVTPTECSSCHTDVHLGTVGRDCERCHNSNSWIVSNVKQIHQQEGFALIGFHATADCNRCHTSASLLRFDNIRSDCFACHQKEYQLTKGTKRDHFVLGFGTDCGRCHSMVGRDWTYNGRGFDHGTFPLTGSHRIDCASCHYGNDFATKLSSECKSCHNPGPARAKYPAHTTKYLNYACSDCHNTTSWASGVKFPQHDSWGRIYSGKHKGKWANCTDCHINDATYKATCNKCHHFSSGNLP